MTRKQIAAKLREALKLMNDTGRHWVKGDYIEAIAYDDQDRPIYGYCSLGAIRTVIGTEVEEPSEESEAVELALAELLPSVLGEDRLTAYSAGDRIVRWNDASDRKWDEVVAKFNEAADRLEALAK